MEVLDSKLEWAKFDPIDIDTLIFVISCNQQRLDGPARRDGKIMQELEADFRGAGSNVIKCSWGSNWDPLVEAAWSAKSLPAL